MWRCLEVGLWEVFRAGCDHKGGASMISILIKRKRDQTSLCHIGLGKKAAICKPGREPHQNPTMLAP